MFTAKKKVQIREVKVQKHKTFFRRVLTILLTKFVKTVRTSYFASLKKQLSVNRCSLFFPKKMATLRKKQKPPALSKEDRDEHPRSNLTQNSNVPRSQEDSITQVPGEIEGRVMKRLSQQFIRT